MNLRLTDAQRRAVRHGLAIAGVIAAAWMYLVVGDATWQHPAADGLVYWGVDLTTCTAGRRRRATPTSTRRPSRRCSRSSGPAEGVFIVGWTVFLAAVAWWLARPWPASLLVLALPVSQEVMIGNIHLLLAAAIVLGFRWPGTWAFVLLTKVTPSVGLVWFPVRREWRALAIALGTTAVIAIVSFLISPDAWQDWFALLRQDGGSQGRVLLVRLAVAAVIVIWGARTDRRWTVPLGAMLALPVIWMDSFSMLLGCVALSERPDRG
jgi:hypothetical protein